MQVIIKGTTCGGIVFQSSSARNLYQDIEYILKKEGVKCASQE